MRYIIGLLLSLSIAQAAYAVVINPNTIINHSVSYNNATLDLTHGNFIIRNGGELIINNSKIIGRLSPNNQSLILVEMGSLKMDGNDVQIDAPEISEHPDVQSLEYVIRLEQAKLELQNNHFVMLEPFRAGLLISSINIPTSDILIAKNNIEGFHGALYLLNSANVIVDSNKLLLNSYGNIVLSGKDGKIINNRIYFSGRDHLGNAMDIINSDGVYIYQNLIFTPTCHGIYIFLSQNLIIDENSINGGITYGITVLSNEEINKDSYAVNFFDIKKLLLQQSKNIMISNNFMSQNRYGIQANDVNGLDIENNYFSQHFDDAVERKFWTDNNVLLNNISNLVWLNNKYKEAFTQHNNGLNNMKEIVEFPAVGGVVLP